MSRPRYRHKSIEGLYGETCGQGDGTKRDSDPTLVVLISLIDDESTRPGGGQITDQVPP